MYDVLDNYCVGAQGTQGEGQGVNSFATPTPLGTIAHTPAIPTTGARDLRIKPQPCDWLCNHNGLYSSGHMLSSLWADVPFVYLCWDRLSLALLTTGLVRF